VFGPSEPIHHNFISKKQWIDEFQRRIRTRFFEIRFALFALTMDGGIEIRVNPRADVVAGQPLRQPAGGGIHRPHGRKLSFLEYNRPTFSLRKADRQVRDVDAAPEIWPPVTAQRWIPDFSPSVGAIYKSKDDSSEGRLANCGRELTEMTCLSKHES
jgi:hypothetical protein